MSPLPSAHDPLWLTAFIKLELTHFYHDGDHGCEVIPPYGTPRFTAVSTNYPDPEDIKNVFHTFSYYLTVNEMLQVLLLAVRTSTGLTVFEYDSVKHVFSAIKPKCITYGYVPARIQDFDERISQRISRMRAIKALGGIHSVTYAGKERFAYVEIRDFGNVELYPVGSMLDVAQAASYLSVAPYVFSAFYDLDVSDQPIPLRFAFRYTDDNGDIYEVAEPR